MNVRVDLLASLADRYIWCRDTDAPSADRIIAQILDIGTYEDTRRLEAAYTPEDLRAVMLRAEPGWIGKRSWNFWRNRLSFQGVGPFPESPPRRAFHEADTLAVSVTMPSGPVKLSFFGGIGFGRVGDPLQTVDGTLLVASVDDLMATKLKAILDRAEARDYRDIAEMLRHGVSLEVGLAAFKSMFRGEPMTVLRALGYFEDGNLASLDAADRDILVRAAARVGELPPVRLVAGTLVVPLGDCDEVVAAAAPRIRT